MLYSETENMHTFPAVKSLKLKNFQIFTAAESANSE